MAARGDFQLKLDPSKVAVVIGGQSKAAARRAAVITQDRVRGNIRAAGRVKTGAMINGIVVEPRPGPALFPTFAVRSTAKHTIYQEEGVRPFRAARGSVLRFQPKGSSSFVFARSSSGFPGAHFMRNAYRSVGPRDFLP